MRPSYAKTPAQKILAKKLKEKKILFLENQTLKGWEVDIFLPEYYLVIEIDGFHHLSAGQKQRDKRKTEELTARGYHVIRFTNSEIYEEGEGCLQQILSIIREHQEKMKKAEKKEPLDDPWRATLGKIKEKLK